jgi:hypothetical protein
MSRVSRPIRAGAVVICLVLLAACDNGTEPTTGFLGCNTIRAYSIGQTVSGSLGSASCRLQSDGSFIDMYEMTVSSQRTVTITMRSNAVDSYLIVWNRSSGAVVAFDDDSGGGLDAQLTHTFPAGTYIIGANTFDAGETGPYTLSSS